jgi:hypothetical protein
MFLIISFIINFNNKVVVTTKRRKIENLRL